MDAPANEWDARVDEMFDNPDMAGRTMPIREF
jgi:hypothetical protein